MIDKYWKEKAEDEIYNILSHNRNVIKGGRIKKIINWIEQNKSLICQEEIELLQDKIEKLENQIKVVVHEISKIN